MNVLLINSSPQQQNASTYCVAKTLLEQWSQDNEVLLQEINVTTIPHVDSAYATALGSIHGEHDESVGSLALSNQLITSLDFADVVIITSPMHNYSVPSGLKNWIDHVVRVGKTFNVSSTGKHGLLRDKPVYILISSGGAFSSQEAYQPDFFTPYMKEVLATIGLNNVVFFSVEGTVGHSNEIHQKIEAVQTEIRTYLRTI
ncbi:MULTISPECIES: FMN-dependent NADH-azoreductase [Vibrio]|uniref:FMN dependent NADH:quinone oxidoreductase n=1 Tax=Vibrio casei TaxID=673372 RepID=A0A368LJ58_9VIBR|nr:MULTISPECIES: NAD(P)H-dependent oxidoreductase [Vibrio]RCS70782.1 flavodoxin family protein [Vibrio casei]SJN25095.1 (Acyl-carrier protein) phosphodiesterase [Vibrio casei]HBV76838.1 ACP phosphodiesterase [Vibrio sp.]